MVEPSVPHRQPVAAVDSGIYAKLLEVVLVLSVGILVIPVSLQIFSRYTALDPVVHLDGGNGALPVRMDDHDRRHDRRPRVDAFRS